MYRYGEEVSFTPTRRVKKEKKHQPEHCIAQLLRFIHGTLPETPRETCDLSVAKKRTGSSIITS